MPKDTQHKNKSNRQPSILKSLRTVRNSKATGEHRGTYIRREQRRALLEADPHCRVIDDTSVWCLACPNGGMQIILDRRPKSLSAPTGGYYGANWRKHCATHQKKSGKCLREKKSEGRVERGKTRSAREPVRARKEGVAERNRERSYSPLFLPGDDLDDDDMKPAELYNENPVGLLDGEMLLGFEVLNTSTDRDIKPALTDSHDEKASEATYTDAIPRGDIERATPNDQEFELVGVESGIRTMSLSESFDSQQEEAAWILINMREANRKAYQL
ncbi:hypothetical protein NMY22_g13396 [Coprinellus aureogranulatus]|nr:hypothetical protein NMY22_g13396 [Coprinellus aureogranulatus]